MVYTIIVNDKSNKMIIDINITEPINSGSKTQPTEMFGLRTWTGYSERTTSGRLSLVKVIGPGLGSETGGLGLEPEPENLTGIFKII